MRIAQIIKRTSETGVVPLIAGIATLAVLGGCGSNDDPASHDSEGTSASAGAGGPSRPEPVTRVGQQQTNCPAAPASAMAQGVNDPFAVRTCNIPNVSHTIPTVPSEIELPAGLSLLGGYRGVGTIFLQCSPPMLPDGTSDTAAPGAWALRTDKVSAATLYGDDCTIVGTLDFLLGLQRGARFTWIDGSQFFGGRTNPGVLPEGVTGGLPWLLQPKSATSGDGFLSRVEYVHRTDTAGGVDPADPCDPSAYPNGILLPFEATYSFYAAAPTNDAGAADAAPE